MATRAGWLEGYATDRYAWRSTEDKTFYRRIGIVESLFDTDGADFEGRADLSVHLPVEVKTRLSPQALRARILLAWSVMRQKHILLSTKVASGVDLRHTLLPPSVAESANLQQIDGDDPFFVFEHPRDHCTMLTEAARHAVFIEDHCPRIDLDEFFVHTLN